MLLSVIVMYSVSSPMVTLKMGNSEKRVVHMPEDETPGMRCPACEKAILNVRSMMYSIPFFNELVMFVLECPECGFYHSDIFSSEQRRPTRFTIRVDDPLLLRTRVVRSSSATYHLPEFGIDVEPGPQAESFISNIEGILLRVKAVVEIATRSADTEQERKNGERVLRDLERAINGDYVFTLIMEDPAGVSGILPDDMSLVKIEELSPEEASQLKGAPMFVDTLREEYRER